MIQIERKENCFGCGACAEACPKECIRMEPDEEGFLYPKADKKICIDCGKCERVCAYNKRTGNEVRAVYAAMNEEKKIRSSSSSGGVFYRICKNIIEKGGAAFGCAWDEEMKARHICVEKEGDINKLQGSKYVQSNTLDSYRQVKEKLGTGRSVLFSGTPCQVAGLKNYLGKDYPRLFTVDVLCHGTPSPKILEEYKKGLEKKYGFKITGINLRDKKKSWKRLFTEIRFENGKRFYTFCGYDAYMSMFLNNMSQRPSCFACKFTTADRQGDITLGDFWGIGKYISKLDDDKGTSMVLVNTEKGEAIWNEIKDGFCFEKTDFSTAESGNRVLSEPPKKNKNRDAFYETFIAEGYEAAVEKWVDIPSKPKQIYYNFMRKGLDLYRFIFRKKY